MSELEIEGGTPPAPPGGDSSTSGPTPPPAPEPKAADLPEWEVKTVGFLLAIPFFALHLTLGRGGPEDAFLPSDRERRAMAQPAASWLNRSTRARKLAPAGDGLAFAGLVGEYVASEQARVARFRAKGAPAQRETTTTVEEDVHGFGVTAAADAEGAPQVRAWRPPTFGGDDAS